MLLLTFSTAMAQTNYWYDPSGDEADGRFLSLSGTGFNTLIKQPISLYIIVPASESGFEIGIFDGDTRGTDIDGNEHWDDIAESTEARYSLYADPGKAGKESILIDSWLGNTDNMPDNDWFTATVNNDPRALEPDGSTYTYRLKAELVDPESSATNNFKIRSSGSLVMAPENAFSFMAAIPRFAIDGKIIYPNFPDLEPTTYDGVWIFKIYVKGSNPTYEVGEVTVWDGDLDHGSYTGLELDTDDLDTSNYVIPAWSSQADTLYEGAQGIGAPADNVGVLPFRRDPAIYYTVTAPDGETVWENPNPSGNQEWEKFTIRSSSHPDKCVVEGDEPNADYCVDRLEQGIYTVTVYGVDMKNLNAFYFPYEILAHGTGSIGDYVWNDLNANGIQDDGETGIAGVTVELYNGEGTLVSTTTTDATGFYLFYNLLADNYTVKIADSNFETGGMLEGWSTSPANLGGDDTVDSDGDDIRHEAEVTLAKGEDNNTIDFGFFESGSIGDYVWNDLNANGIQDDGEPGIAGVTIELYDDQGTLLNTTTDTNGYYLFEDLPAGNYTVKVADSNFEGGGVLEDWSTSPANQGSNDELDSDGDETSHEAAVTLAVGEDNDTIDFGFFEKGSIGDFVWYDLNGNGIQDDGELGIEGVIVELYDDQGTLLNTTTTDTNGYYLFENLLAGNYTVKVADSNFETGGVLEGWVTSPANQGSNDELDSDGDETSHEAAVTLAAGEDNDTIDFGFFERMGGQGCTPGYWKQKQHFDSWVGYTQNDSFADIFGVPYSKTLLEALKTGGGKEKALGRHAVAALLNVAAHGVNYYYTEHEIISMVQQAWTTGDYETPKDLLAVENERGCPLN
jgi:hypothetical protein